LTLVQNSIEQSNIIMGLFRYVAAFALLSLLTLEGLNPTLTAEAEKGAAGFIGLLANQFKFDAKPILAQLPNLRYVALVALGALIFKLYGLVLALYVIVTRGVGLLTRYGTIMGNISSKGPAEGAAKSGPELVYVLTTVAIVGFLFDWALCCKSKNCAAPKPKHAQK
jgi:hypothetical protein